MKNKSEQIDKKTINEIFDECDTNKDGELDFEEAKKFLMHDI